MKTPRVAQISEKGLLVMALVLLAAGGMILLTSFASRLIPKRRDQQAIHLEPLDTVNNFHTAVNNERVPAMMDLFAEDAIVIDGANTFTGRTEIQNWALRSSRMSGTQLTLISSQASDGKVIWYDLARSGSGSQAAPQILHWMAVFEDGRIKTLSVTLRPLPDGK